MTPAAQTVYIDLATGAVRSATTGDSPPDINLILLTGGRLNFAFMNVTDGVGTVVDIEAATTGKFVIKEVDGADEDPIFLDVSIEKEGSGTTARYFFKGLIDSAGLQTSIGGQTTPKTFVALVHFTQPSDDHPSSCDPFEITIKNNLNRSDDAAPPASAVFSLVVNDDGTAAEMFVNGTSVGFLHLHTTAP